MSPTAEVLAATDVEAPDLIIDSLTVRFGGLVAVDNVSITARGGVITGLIGPNGAGKTTTFNSCTGLNTPETGTVTLGDRTLDGHSASWRARLGLGRTFQRMELFETMTVRDNVELAEQYRHVFGPKVDVARGRGLDGVPGKAQAFAAAVQTIFGWV